MSSQDREGELNEVNLSARRYISSPGTSSGSSVSSGIEGATTGSRHVVLSPRTSTPQVRQVPIHPGGYETPANPNEAATTAGRTPVAQTIRTSTSGATTTPTSTSSRANPIEPLDRSTIVAVVEGRGQARGEIGIALMNMHTPTLTLCQFNDTQSYVRLISKINIFRPYEVLMSATACETSSPSQLFLQLKKEVANVKMVPIQRRIFNEGKGLQKLHTLAAEEYAPVVHTLTNKYYCLAACHALFKYIELSHSTIFASHSLRIEFQGCEQTCMIDHVTSQHLELLQNNSSVACNHSLLGIVNTCKTPSGSRLLRMNILQPSCEEKFLVDRLDCVEELIKEREILFGLQDIFGRLPIDIEHVIATLVQIPKVTHARVTEQRINYVIALKHILELVPNLCKVLEPSPVSYFQTVRGDLTKPQFDRMLQSIKSIIHDEAVYQKGTVNMKRQRCFAVKADINPILDVARRAYCDIVDDINKYILDLSRQAGLNFRLASSNQRGFYVQLFVPNRTDAIPDLPSYCLQVKKRGNLITFTTEALISIDHRAQEVSKEIENLSNIVISELISSIRDDISILYKVSDAIGSLDLIQSLANYAIVTPRCVRPSFATYTTAITMGRHPILDSISAEPTVPNNTCLTDTSSFMLITGPNMSGKTTYIKHVAILQVMAQIGSFVPADAATFRIASNIMSRIGTGDNIEENSSSFALEMTEMTYILQNISNDSLIIIDELGRATSIEEGAAISWAIAEELAKKKAYVLFATHHMKLTKLEVLYSNIKNYAMETEEWDNPADRPIPGVELSSKLKYTHSIKPGVTKVELYGLKLAMNTSYPPKIIQNALDMSKRITADRVNPANSSAEQNHQTLKLACADQLLLAAEMFKDDEDTDPEDIRQFLESLQEEFKTTLGYAQTEIP